MKYLRQFLIILAVSFAGELLNLYLPLPVPASIYGMVRMFTCLATGFIPLEKVKDTAFFLIEIMPVMFIPAGVGLMASWGELKSFLAPALCITVIVLFCVIAASGWTSQLIIRRGGKRQ